jgi:hypothetical protein
MKALFIALCLTLFAGTATAAGTGPPGTEIIPGCENLVDRTAESTPAAGYCAGVLNTLMLLSQANPLICLPNGITTLELAYTVLLWKKEPEKLIHEFVGLAAIALTVSYPCPMEDENVQPETE